MASKASVDLGMWYGPQEVDLVMGSDVSSRYVDDKKSFCAVNLSDTNATLSVELLYLLFTVLARDLSGAPGETYDRESIQAILGEGFAKILLLSENYPSIPASLHHELLAKLIKLYFSDEAEELQRLKQCLSVFFEHYPALTVVHKRCISEAFIPVIRLWNTLQWVLFLDWHREENQNSNQKMDEELLELQRQFEFSQQAKSSILLADIYVVELVQKLQELRIIDFDLLHTVSGKEYITPDQLKYEMVTEIKKSGRVSLIDLSDIIGVDLYHIEKQAQVIVDEDKQLMLIQGELISQSYWDNVAEEINERLQDCSQISLAELAAQLHVGSELLASVLEPRLGSIVKGRFEGWQIYTPAHVARVSARVRGATRDVTVPINLTAVWSSLQQVLQEMNGTTSVAVDGSFFQSLFNRLVKEGDILGSIRARVHWTPTVFAHAQKESVDSFFSQNSFVSYEVLKKLAIPQHKQYLQSRYPEGIALDTVFVHPSMIEMLDSAAEDDIEQKTWIDCPSVLPPFVGSQDASKLLSLCPSVQRALKSTNALILGDSCVLSNEFAKDIFDRMEKETFILSKSASQELHVVNKALGLYYP